MNSEDHSTTLAACAKEPIHVPGKIQPHGVLLAFNEQDRRLMQVSANCGDIFMCSPADLLGKSLDDLLVQSSMDEIKIALGSGSLGGHNPHRIETIKGSHIYNGILHRSGTL